MTQKMLQATEKIIFGGKYMKAS